MEVSTVRIASAAGAHTVDRAGPDSGELVVLLHGFPQSRHTWRAQLPALAAAGYVALAPDQRGYSPGARPDPADLANYGLDRLAGDVLDLAAAVGRERFHLVGHDWGGQVAWFLAARDPTRILTLTVLSRPHPNAFARAIRENADGQRFRSRHHRAFHDDRIVDLLLGHDARQLRQRLGAEGVHEAQVEEYLSVVGNRPALEAALAWYRSVGSLASTEIGPIEVPTLYVWGVRDSTVGPAAAQWTQAYVNAPYLFAALPGVGHFVTDQEPDLVNSLLLEHLRRFAGPGQPRGAARLA